MSILRPAGRRRTATDAGGRTVELRVIGWDHERCMAPLRACAAAFSEARGVSLAVEARSLLDFGDQPLEELAGRYDAIVLDHPFCGSAAAAACLRPLDGLVDADTLLALERDAVGATHASYRYGGHQWAFAVDAACQVSAVRDDLLDGPPPATWGEVLALARERPGRVALPLAPAHAISAFLTLCANAGAPPADGDRLADPDVAGWAVATLAELHRLGPPEAIAWEPPEALAHLADAGPLAFVPLVYGYSTYPCRFVDIPSAGAGPVGAVLGGAGIAVSAVSPHPADAAAFAAFMASPAVQRDLVAASGGQPASRAVWDDPVLDHVHRGFFSGTRRTLDAAWVRPRRPWWPRFQLDAGRLLAAALAAGEPAEEVRGDLEALYRRARG